MCKRNSPDRNEAVWDAIPQLKMKTARDVSEKLPRFEKEASMGCVR